MNSYIWEPTQEYLDCKAGEFLKLHGISNIKDLIDKSIDDTDWFWDNALKFMGFDWDQKYSQIMDDCGNVAQTSWFLDGKLNIAKNCLDYHVQPNSPKLGIRDRAGSDSIAVIWENELGLNSKLTYGQLYDLSNKVAKSLVSHGFKPGDAIAIYMPMTAEMIAIFFGCLRIGVIVIPIFSGYGHQAIADRLNDAKAKAIFTVNGSYRKGKIITLVEEARVAVAVSPSVHNLIVVKHIDSSTETLKNPNEKWFHDFIENNHGVDLENYTTQAEDKSLYLYTSGTTGAPKACVHTHAGALAQIAKEHGFCFDVRLGDVFFWITDLGWMMGPWKIIGALFWGATVMLYEGAPNHPNSNHLFKIIEKYKVNILGISPTLIRTLKGASDLNIDAIDLTSLKYLGAAGEPFDEDSYMWFFNKVGLKNCPVVNFSGGTEVIGGFLTPYPLIPCKPCSLGFKGLAMDVGVYDEDGNEVVDKVGHLVCRKPSPSMTKGFLNAHEKYIDTYFSKFTNTWYHGDWAKIDPDGYWFLYGRSDDTIKIAGKRLGPSEVEAILTSHDNVVEAAVIGIPDEIKGESIVCFIVLNTSVYDESQVIHKLIQSLVDNLGHSFKPKSINIVKALPKTRSGKIVRKTIKQKYLNQSKIDMSSIENPESLDLITAKA